MHINSVFAEKMKEAAASVLPISGIVALLCFIFVPMDVGLMLSFVLATALLIAGMALFTLGAEMSMTRIGNHIGAKMTRFRRLGLILLLSFVLGIAITVAEPDLQVLAANVPDINSTVLIITVSVGVGLFLMLCMVRILFSISLRWMLIVLYGIVFLGAALSDPKILGVAFDSGGVTTGPMTVPFIMAMGVGVASIRSDENAKADSFGLVALCSVGPILAVMLLNAIYTSDTPTNVFPSIHVYNSLAVHIALHRSEWFQKHKAFDTASLILCVSICMSTVLLKQHSITDVIGASILMAVMYTLVYATDYSRLLKKSRDKEIEMQ